MTKAELAKALNERVYPMLQELGVEGCVITGYLSSGEGRLGKFSLLVSDHNCAIEDGLAPLVNFSAMWCAPAREFSPPAVTPDPPLGDNG